MRQTLIVAVAIYVGVAEMAVCQPVRNDQPASNRPTASAQRIQQLIDQLGSEQFLERETASAALLEIGEPALLPLHTAERGKDSEVSSRAKAIRDRIEHDRFEAISLSFKRDPDPTASYGLPGWKSFSKAAGTSRPAKRLFLEMLEHRAVFAMCLESIDGGKVPEGVFEGLPDDPEQRLKTVVGKACLEIRTNLLSLYRPAEAGDLIAMLVVMQVLDEPPVEVHDATRMLCNMGGLARLMAMPGAAPAARKIIGVWMLKAPVTYGEDLLSIAGQVRVPEARNMALRMLDAPVETQAKAQAFWSLEQFGLPEDLPLIDKFIDNAEVTGEFNPPGLSQQADVQEDAQAPPNRQGRAQRPLEFSYRQTLGDLALIAGCRIAGLDVEKIFPAIRISEANVITKHSVGFPVKNPAVREKAVKLYKEHRAQMARPAS